ncbi:UDP-N-acetylmuramoyl-L-alanyl-D-glutamate--2,6-diaminopimelate ligase [Candidatus Albibeggiatoa sp. nov. NOAA]|uniref:UDP-N-acetylmuramoyl-L-alanyl-D-glutamate--2, 6-diaminopimelate ligase n=1 Tax=Candidatus Albibeggiatoa sp. nov. NOAA TaxID=3162724 RepID=UPI0032F2F49F|nr:UDP-N-acetylmuramoyl-L-alanyl-D-glutamate--2,6-diaminopimelate ligase [Thiotrichaceae bacterium]
MKLSQLIESDLVCDPDISGLTLDSRQVKSGDVFFALAGTQVHGERFIPMAIQNGAAAILREAAEFQTYTKDKICHVDIPNLSQKLGSIAARFYNQPSQSMQVVGITGTNGKTSVSHYVAQLLPQTCGLLGTLGYGVYGQLQAGQHTTPDAIRLQALFAEFKQQAIQHVVMEVSSHALVQGRVNGIEFDTAVFTNLSRDHLDYHQTMQAYQAAKLKLFQWDSLKTAIVNQDDALCKTIQQHLATNVRYLTYSIMDEAADIYAKIVQQHQQGYTLHIHTPWGQGQVELNLFGQFNIRNVLAALSVVLNQGMTLDDALDAVQKLQAVAGRMQCLIESNQPTIIIDYAHTPDALEKVLRASRQHCSGQLHCVFGCGGDRDKGKRPEMGQIAQQFADKVVITDDNPRHESSQAIIDDILSGCQLSDNNLQIVADRAQAIHTAIDQAQQQDIVVIAGKGHEDYQQVGDAFLHFSDEEQVREVFGAMQVR